MVYAAAKERCDADSTCGGLEKDSWSADLTPDLTVMLRACKESTMKDAMAPWSCATSASASMKKQAFGM